MTAPASSDNSAPEPEEAKGSRQRPESKPVPPALYLTATPIGNLGDFTIRACEVLAQCDLILCEDTRVTAKLLQRYGLSRPTAPYHEHNAASMRPRVLAALADGKRVALLSDAGTPLISDPGFKLVRAAIEAGHAVTALPGASAVLAALCLSGLPPDRFFFAGFLDHKQAARRRELESYRHIPGSLIFLESPQRLAASLRDMADILGPRDAAVARELTKLHEEVRRGGLQDLAEAYAESGPPKGEIVVVVGPPAQAAIADPADIDRLLRQRLAAVPLKLAVEEVAAASGAPRRDIYRRALAIKDEQG